MFPQTTLDHALVRAALAERRAEAQAKHRAPKAVRPRGARSAVRAPAPVPCCA